MMLCLVTCQGRCHFYFRFYSHYCFLVSRILPMVRLPRFQVAFDEVFQRGPPCGSTLITSAPWSAISIPANGPAMYYPKSITRNPSSTPAMSPPYSFTWSGQ